ncbi:hypothetical protein D9M68_573990 [compost metagenome]
MRQLGEQAAVRVAGHHQAAFGAGFLAGDAGDRRFHRGVVEIDLPRLHLGLGRFDVGLALLEVGDRIVQLALAGVALLLQFAHPLEVALGLPVARLLLRQRTLGPRQGGLVGARVDAEQHLALGHRRAFLVGALLENAADLGTDFHLAIAGGATGIFQHQWHRLGGSFLHHHLGCRMGGTRRRRVGSQCMRAQQASQNNEGKGMRKAHSEWHKCLHDKLETDEHRQAACRP